MCVGVDGMSVLVKLGIFCVADNSMKLLLAKCWHPQIVHCFGLKTIWFSGNSLEFRGHRGKKNKASVVSGSVIFLSVLGHSYSAASEPNLGLFSVQVLYYPQPKILYVQCCQQLKLGSFNAASNQN